MPKIEDEVTTVFIDLDWEVPPRGSGKYCDIIDVISKDMNAASVGEAVCVSHRGDVTLSYPHLGYVKAQHVQGFKVAKTEEGGKPALMFSFHDAASGDHKTIVIARAGNEKRLQRWCSNVHQKHAGRWIRP